MSKNSQKQSELQDEKLKAGNTEQQPEKLINEIFPVQANSPDEAGASIENDPEQLESVNENISMEAPENATQMQNNTSSTSKELEDLKNQYGMMQALFNSGAFGQNNSQSMPNQIQAVQNQEIAHLEGMFNADLAQIADAFKQHKITRAQAEQMFDMLKNAKAEERAKIVSKYQMYGKQMADQFNNAVLDSFSKQREGFLEVPERKEVIDYLKSAYDIIDPVELNRVADFIGKVEESAVKRFQTQDQSQKELLNQNNQAKSRLTSSIDSAVPAGYEGKKIFTRAEIARMNFKEFERNEKTILDQMAKGLIK